MMQTVSCKPVFALFACCVYSVICPCNLKQSAKVFGFDVEESRIVLGTLYTNPSAVCHDVCTFWCCWSSNCKLLPSLV